MEHLDLIRTLIAQGKSNKEISEYLNNIRNIQTIRVYEFNMKERIFVGDDELLGEFMVDPEREKYKMYLFTEFSGRKLQQVRRLKDRYNIGLKEAKEEMDKFWEEN